MQIKVYGNFQFCDNSANCCENGELAMLEKNYDKIDKAFNDAMCVVFSSGYYEDY